MNYINNLQSDYLFHATIYFHGDYHNIMNQYIAHGVGIFPCFSELWCPVQEGALRCADLLSKEIYHVFKAFVVLKINNEKGKQDSFLLHFIV